jgi:hypothetical protein
MRVSSGGEVIVRWLRWCPLFVAWVFAAACSTDDAADSRDVSLAESVALESVLTKEDLPQGWSSSGSGDGIVDDSEKGDPSDPTNEIEDCEELSPRDLSFGGEIAAAEGDAFAEPPEDHLEVQSFVSAFESEVSAKSSFDNVARVLYTCKPALGALRQDRNRRHSRGGG